MISDKNMRLLIQQLASHSKISNKWFTVKTKPARKGTVNGIGSDKYTKVPKNSHRATVTFTELFKRTLSEMIEENQL